MSWKHKGPVQDWTCFYCDASSTVSLCCLSPVPPFSQVRIHTKRELWPLRHNCCLIQRKNSNHTHIHFLLLEIKTNWVTNHNYSFPLIEYIKIDTQILAKSTDKNTHCTVNVTPQIAAVTDTQSSQSSDRIEKTQHLLLFFLFFLYKQQKRG